LVNFALDRISIVGLTIHFPALIIAGEVAIDTIRLPFARVGITLRRAAVLEKHASRGSGGHHQYHQSKGNSNLGHVHMNILGLVRLINGKPSKRLGDKKDPPGIVENLYSLTWTRPSRQVANLKF
jgi:hypothetical protein